MEGMFHEISTLWTAQLHQIRRICYLVTRLWKRDCLGVDEGEDGDVFIAPDDEGDVFGNVSVPREDIRSMGYGYRVSSVGGNVVCKRGICLSSSPDYVIDEDRIEPSLEMMVVLRRTLCNLQYDPALDDGSNDEYSALHRRLYYQINSFLAELEHSYPSCVGVVETCVQACEDKGDRVNRAVRFLCFHF